MQDQLKYYRMKFSGERSRLARILDYILLRLLLFSISYFWLLFQLRNHKHALLFSFIVVVLFSIASRILYNIRFERFREKQERLLKQTALEDSLAILPRKKFLDICREFLFAEYHLVCREQNGTLLCDSAYLELLQTDGKSPVQPNELLKFYQSAQSSGKETAFLLCTGNVSFEALSLAQRIRNIRLEFPKPEKLIRFMQENGYGPSTKELEELMHLEIQARTLELSKIKRSVLTPLKAKRYLMCSGLLLVSSFLTGYGVYYRIMAGLCLLLSLLALLSPKFTSRA